MSEKQNIQITVDHRGNTLYRNYAVEDGQVPEGVQKGVQEMVDTINDTLDNPSYF